MSQKEHAPGPWRLGVHPTGACFYIHYDKTNLGDIAVVYTSRDNALANAMLIVAAPETAAERDRLQATNAELVTALKGAEKVIAAISDDHWNPALERIRYIIAKAEGC